MKHLIRKSPHFESKAQIILRDFLALERTKLSNERTFLSYLRTSLYMLLAAIAFLKIESLESVKWGVPLMLFLSVVTLVIGVGRFIYLKKRLRRYYVEMEQQQHKSKSFME
ncbi:MAG: DUF202 domain-containing protein [Bernardetiaceae bacterium]|nr:DUF202 domain-containing protein [Bernardetiaceae bacterium]